MGYFSQPLALAPCHFWAMVLFDTLASTDWVAMAVHADTAHKAQLLRTDHMTRCVGKFVLRFMRYGSQIGKRKQCSVRASAKCSNAECSGCLECWTGWTITLTLLATGQLSDTSTSGLGISQTGQITDAASNSSCLLLWAFWNIAGTACQKQSVLQHLCRSSKSHWRRNCSRDPTLTNLITNCTNTWLTVSIFLSPVT